MAIRLGGGGRGIKKRIFAASYYGSSASLKWIIQFFPIIKRGTVPIFYSQSEKNWYFEKGMLLIH